jgi:hypothetical protein
VNSKLVYPIPAPMWTLNSSTLCGFECYHSLWSFEVTSFKTIYHSNQCGTLYNLVSVMQISLSGLDLTKGQQGLYILLTYKKHGTNIGSNENPKQLPYLPSWCTFKKIAIGDNWTKNDTHVMCQDRMISSCMDFLEIFHGSWHICKVNFVDSSITTCEICDIYWLLFFSNITTWC